MKRRVLLVDDEISILLTLKAVLEISGFDVDTATSAFEGKRRIKQYEYEMIITDMRMENDAAGAEVIALARTATYNPAVALLTAFPVAEEDWQSMGADEMLVKPMHTQVLLTQIEALLVTHEDKKRSNGVPKSVAAKTAKPATKKVVKKKAAKKSAVKKVAAKRNLRRKRPSQRRRPSRKQQRKSLWRRRRLQRKRSARHQVV